MQKVRQAEAEQIIARETAKNSEVKARAEAMEGEAAIKEQQVIGEGERANQAQRFNQSQAAEAEYKAILAAVANLVANSQLQPCVTCTLFGGR
jgi:hypothetical protein